ncbi:MAG: dihydropteroate synthase, partial [Syntrophales bacterium LBB04]|nr:dihydropteroate synthase [Syntrophales bacterium LBB04]
MRFEVLIIGERINSSRSAIAQAIELRDAKFIQQEAKVQEEAGAHYLDVNAGSMFGRETECLSWLVETVQKVTNLPLALDTPDPVVIKELLPKTETTPMINSVTLDPGRIEELLPLVVERNARVIALCQSSELVPETADAKVRLAAQLVEKATAWGVPLDHLYIDPLVFPLSANPQSALTTLDSIQQIMARFPGVHTVCGMSNVSYGLPLRKLVNRSFLVACICHGLDAAIIDPVDKQSYGAL